MVPVILVVIILNFVIVHLAPGDPALIMSGQQADWKYIEAMREKWGLDKPIYEQLFIYLGAVAQGDLGFSIAQGRPVFQILMEKILSSMLLVLVAEFVSLGIGIILGVYAARKYLSKLDTSISIVSLVFYSMPPFWLGLMLIILFSLNLHWFPITGLISFGVKPEIGLEYYLNILWHLFLPALTLTLTIGIPIFTRITRASMVEVMNEEYILTARAKGLSENRIFFVHALRNALIPVITAAHVWIGMAFTGAVVIEIVFGWPGLGKLMFDSVAIRDYPVLMGIFIVVAVIVVVSSLIADILAAFLDRRITFE